MSKRIRVFVAHQDVPQCAVDKLREHKFDVTVSDKNRPSPEEVSSALAQYDALLGLVKIDEAFLDIAGDRLKVISTLSTGYDHMDISAIKKRGIKVGHVQNVMSAAVAEIAIFLLLAAARRSHEARLLPEQEKLENVSNLKSCFGPVLFNKTVGIVGLGNIGKEILMRLSGFQVNKVLYSGRSRKKAIEKELGVEFVSFDVLLKQSDFVICAAPLTPETDEMFNDEAFEKMKKTAVFVNIGRGKIVDTDALVRALKNKTIFAAGLDVTNPEPLPVDHDLFKLPNAWVLPHAGARTIETQSITANTAAQNIINFFQKRPLLYEI